MNQPNHSCIMDDPAAEWDFAIRLDNNLDALWPLAEAVEGFGQQCGWTDALMMQINLVLEEWIVNAISHGYPDARKGQISVYINHRHGIITVRITDDGDAFDPFGVAIPDLALAIEDRPIGGLGIHLVRSYMDGYHYRRLGTHNEVTLTKHCAP